MKTYYETLETPVTEEYEVIVAGGGSAGFGAALSAARNGAKTLLIEREFMIGGIMTAGLMAKIAIEPFMTGIPTEFLMRLGEVKMAIPYGKFPKPWPLSEMVEIPVDAEACKLLSEEMLQESGARILYGTMVVGIVKNGKAVQGVIVENKNGRSVIPGKVFIDATGDGDLCYQAGASYEYGINHNGVCSATNILSRIGRVHLDKTIDYLEEHPEELVRRNRRGEVSGFLTADMLREYAFAENPQFVQIGNFGASVQKKLDDPNVSDWEKNVLQLRGGVTFMNTPIADQVLVNTGRYKDINGLDAMSLSDAMIECRKQNWCIFKFLKENIPGFEDAHLIETSAIPGTRETRRIICDYVHTLEDFKNRVRFEDAILRSDDCIEFHNPSGAGTHFELYTKGEYEEISYRSILVKGFENLMAIGRCWSAEQLALSANRSIGFCMGMGQAAGMAAAMAVKGRTDIRSIDVKVLQEAVYPLKEE